MNRNPDLWSRAISRLLVLVALGVSIAAAPILRADQPQTVIPTETSPSKKTVDAPSTPPPIAPPPPAAAVAPAPSRLPNTAPSSPVLTVGPYDTLHIEMDGQPDLSRDYVVDANGDIQLLYVGKVRVGGLTLDQAQDVVVARLRKLYHTVNLTLTRTALGGISVTVTGAIARTGPISVRRDSRLNDVIQPSSPLPEADLNHVQITHAGAAPDLAATVVDLGAYLETGAAAGNPPLKDGDVIFIPSRPRAATRTFAISVVGAVPRPGRFDVTPGTTAYDAITLAGGLANDADIHAVYIESLSHPEHKVIDWNQLSIAPGSPDINPILGDGDKIVVPEATIASTFSIMGAVRTPNTYPLRGNVSLLDALAMAGGFDAGAVEKDVKVVRVASKGATTIPVNAEDPIKAAQFTIEPNDHIIVPSEKAKSPGYRVDPMAAIGLALTIWAVTK
ncbi:MAG: SLBB domain-containing protein [Capsulimonadaceae bacterium]|nr:SLBB domain-containing protein [Capsulimonadaceae bacterium]